jgi:hypothetical protein
LRNRDVALRPDSETDQGSWDVWVPVPRGADRRFFVQVQLYNDRRSVPIGRLRTATLSGSDVVP